MRGRGERRIHGWVCNVRHENSFSSLWLLDLLPISNAYEQIILRYVTLHNPHSTSHSCKQKISCQSTIYAQTSEWIREEPGVGSLPLIIWKPENERARREANTWVGLQRPTWEYLFIIMTIRSAAHFKRIWADYSTLCNATQSPQHFSFLQTKDFMPKFLQSSQITTCVIINLRNKSHSSIVRTEEQDRKVDTQTYFEKPPYLSVGFWQN
jgi:hypothetical protein